MWRIKSLRTHKRQPPYHPDGRTLSLSIGKALAPAHPRTWLVPIAEGDAFPKAPVGGGMGIATGTVRLAGEPSSGAITCTIPDGPAADAVKGGCRAPRSGLPRWPACFGPGDSEGRALRLVARCDPRWHRPLRVAALQASSRRATKGLGIWSRSWIRCRPMEPAWGCARRQLSHAVQIQTLS